MKTIWQQLTKPIFSLAPMEDVTDSVFRQVLLATGRPAIWYTEFTNVDGMFSKGEEKVTQRLQFVPKEKPLIAQIWGTNPENFFKAAQKLRAMDFDGIDINMGCPQKDVTSHGACSALIKNHALTAAIIRSTKDGAGDLPVSVKTRIGFSTIATEEWIGFLLQQDVAVITVHGRTVKEMSKVPAHWDEIGKAVQLRNTMGSKTLIFGNGDVQSLSEAREKVSQYGLDGIMIGRGIFHNPWLFDENIDPATQTLAKRIRILLKHVRLWEKTWGNAKHFPVLKKYFKIYLSGFDSAADIRMQFMEATNRKEVEKVAKKLLKKV